MEDKLTGLGAQALAELDIIQMQPALGQLRRGLRTAIDDFATSQRETPTAWVGLLMALGREAGAVLGGMHHIPDAASVFQMAVGSAAAEQAPDEAAIPVAFVPGAFIPCDEPDAAWHTPALTPPAGIGDVAIDDMATALLSDALLVVLGRHMRASTPREAYVFEALRALADAATVVLRAAKLDPAAQEFFVHALAGGIARASPAETGRPRESSPNGASPNGASPSGASPNGTGMGGQQL